MKFLFLLFLAFPYWTYGQTCNPYTPINMGIASAVKSSNEIFIKSASNLNVESFCRESLREGMSQFSFNMSERWLQGIIKENSDLHKIPDDFLETDDEGEIFADPWAGSLYPNEKTRTWNYHLCSLPNKWSHLSYVKSKEAQDKKFASFKTEKDVLKASKQNIGVCMLYLPLKAKSCAKALNRIIELTQKQNDIILPSLLKTVFNDERYTQAAVKLSESIETKIKNGTVPKTDLYSDAKNAFESLGIKSSEAESMALNILAIYGARGPNMYKLAEVATKENTPFLQAMTKVGAGTVVLDSRSFHSGHPYSYPSNVTSSCDNGKPYHFWLSAYISKTIAEEFKDPELGLLSTFIAEMGYQMLSETAGRDPSKPFTVPCFDAGNNKLRMDMAYATAGASFGVAPTKKINVDEALKAMIKKTKCQEVLDQESAEQKWNGLDAGYSGYHRWKKIMAPDAALDYLKK